MPLCDLEHSVLNQVADKRFSLKLINRRAGRMGSAARLSSLSTSTFPTREKGVTPVNLFEGVAVGALLALEENESLKPRVGTGWLASPDLRKLVSSATNSRPKVVGRIEYLGIAFSADEPHCRTDQDRVCAPDGDYPASCGNWRPIASSDELGSRCVTRGTGTCDSAHVRGVRKCARLALSSALGGSRQPRHWERQTATGTQGICRI
jgi:hypothetical protein